MRLIDRLLSRRASAPGAAKKARQAEVSAKLREAEAQMSAASATLADSVSKLRAAVTQLDRTP